MYSRNREVRFRRLRKLLYRLLGASGYYLLGSLYHRLLGLKRALLLLALPTAKGGAVDPGKLLLNFGSRADFIPLLRERVRAPVATEAPLVSIIILNHNGLSHLQRLFPSLISQTIYANVEFILADNASTDGSPAWALAFGLTPLRVLNFATNLSFARANNLAAQEAGGDYLLFLNNDIEVGYGWLNELVFCLEKDPQAACAAGTLIYPEIEVAAKGGDLVPPGLSVQHSGIAFVAEEDSIRPYNVGRFQLPLAVGLEPREVPAVTAACALWRHDCFLDVGGFEEGYEYGYEDVDLGLKTRQAGRKSLYCPTSFCFHHEFGTQAGQSAAAKQLRRQENQRHFMNRWGDRLKRDYWREKLFGQPFWATEPLTIAMTVTEYHPLTTCGDYFTAKGLGAALEKLGFRVVYLPRRPLQEWYELPEVVDVLLVLMDGYQLPKLRCRPGVIKVAWARNWIDRWLKRPWLSEYDLLLASSPTALEALKLRSADKQPGHVMLLAADADRFQPLPPDTLLLSDLCFVGNLFQVPREIVTAFKPDGRRFRFWGRLEAEPDHSFTPYHEGVAAYDQVPLIYSSAKIVFEDCTTMCGPWGCLNSRTFEAMACGACVISNAVVDQEELFGDALLVYHSPRELEELIDYYLSHDHERQVLGAKARELVLAGHTYDHRALELQNHLANLFGVVS